MNQPTNRFPQNVPGPFYVTDDCIDCDQCRCDAPKIFRHDEALGASVVYHQPETPEEWADAQEALDSCPVEAIVQSAIPAKD